MKPGNQFRGFRFDERTNIGQSENSQGTLFQVKRGRDQKGPKGFSPDRQDEVRELFENRDPDYGPPFSRIQAHQLPGQEPLKYAPKEGGRRVELTPQSLGQKNANLRVIQDMISRSTAPLLKDPDPDNTTSVEVVQANDPNLNRPGMSGNTVGLYQNPKMYGGHRILVRTEAIRPGVGASPTLIHELGHRDSWIRGNDHAKYDTPERQGKEEAYADDFAVKHTRVKDGRALPFLGSYPTPSRMDYNAGQQFRRAYDSNRTTPTEKAPVQWPKDEQQTLLHKVVDHTYSLEGHPIAPPPGHGKYHWSYKGEGGFPSDRPSPL